MNKHICGLQKQKLPCTTSLLSMCVCVCVQIHVHVFFMYSRVLVATYTVSSRVTCFKGWFSHLGGLLGSCHIHPSIHRVHSGIEELNTRQIFPLTGTLIAISTASVLRLVKKRENSCRTQCISCSLFQRS